MVTRNTCGHICICIIIYRLAALHKNKTYLLSHNEYFEFGYLSGVCVCVVDGITILIGMYTLIFLVHILRLPFHFLSSVYGWLPIEIYVFYYPSIVFQSLTDRKVSIHRLVGRWPEHNLPRPRDGPKYSIPAA